MNPAAQRWSFNIEMRVDKQQRRITLTLTDDFGFCFYLKSMNWFWLAAATIKQQKRHCFIWIQPIKKSKQHGTDEQDSKSWMCVFSHTVSGSESFICCVDVKTQQSDGSPRLLYWWGGCQRRLHRSSKCKCTSPLHSQPADVSYHRSLRRTWRLQFLPAAAVFMELLQHGGQTENSFLSHL